VISLAAKKRGSRNFIPAGFANSKWRQDHSHLWGDATTSLLMAALTLESGRLRALAPLLPIAELVAVLLVNAGVLPL